MNKDIVDILAKKDFSKSDIVSLLSCQGEDMEFLFDKALQTKLEVLDNKVHLRGLIEYSNICRKDCLYCGLRKDNKKVQKYNLTDEEVLSCAKLAVKFNYGSIAIQSGERQDETFVSKIEYLIKKIKQISGGALGITLSLGEQSKETYERWFSAGAHRYLLRIESSNKELFYKIHPKDDIHLYEDRIRCIDDLLSIGYQTGTGCMIGLPFQTNEDLADDLLFFKEKDVAMVGMGPFIPHPDTPLWRYRDIIPSNKERMQLTLKMIAVLRLMMPKINMVSATANQTIDPLGREQAIACGANVIMPNLSPEEFRDEYLIYPDKAFVHDKPEECLSCLYNKMKSINHEILYGAWGDSKAFEEKNKK